FEIDVAGPLVERALLFAQRQLRPLRGFALVAFLGQLLFEEPPFQVETGAGLLFRVLGKRLEARLVLMTKLFRQRLTQRDFGAAVGADDGRGIYCGRHFESTRVDTIAAADY